MDETFFVKIQDPEHLRISVLAASKLSLESLKIHLKLNDLHKEKVEAKNSLNKQLVEFVKFLNNLATLLPHQEILEHLKKSRTSKKTVTKAKTKKVVKKNQTELDKLNEALDAIEKRLGSLQ